MVANFPISSRSASFKQAFSQQELYQSLSTDIRAAYKRALSTDQESVTTVRGNDVSGRFRVAYAQLPMTGVQRSTVCQFETWLEKIEKNIDPKRLLFSISSSPDDDIVLNHRHKHGLCTIIIHDDGSLALSRIYSQSATEHNDELVFFEAVEADYEELAYLFLVGQ